MERGGRGWRGDGDAVREAVEAYRRSMDGEGRGRETRECMRAF